jgi:hypothetical protein
MYCLLILFVGRRMNEYGCGVPVPATPPTPWSRIEYSTEMYCVQHKWKISSLFNENDFSGFVFLEKPGCLKI